MRVALSYHLRIHLNPFQLWTVTEKQDLTLLFTFNCTFLPPPCTMGLLCSRANNFFISLLNLWEIEKFTFKQDQSMGWHNPHWGHMITIHKTTSAVTASEGKTTVLLFQQRSTAVLDYIKLHPVSTTIRSADWPKGYRTLLDSPFKDVLKTITVTLFGKGKD